ncbi:MAG: DUF167 domain-containing protein [Candidatus Omnitrophica bacterium]|nr:DUF167 domain-containing protein [Candidatus Omnitrophota bacterium]
MQIIVKVVPHAKKERVEATTEGLKVYINAPAIEGRANKKLIEVLAEHFKTKKYNIEIIAGQKTRKKIIEIRETH